MPLGKEVGLGPGHTVLDGDPVGTQPPTAAPPHCRPMPIMAKRSPISATAELLLSDKIEIQEQRLKLESTEISLAFMLAIAEHYLLWCWHTMSDQVLE